MNGRWMRPARGFRGITSVVAIPNPFGIAWAIPCLPFSKHGVILDTRRSPSSKYVPLEISVGRFRM